MPSCVEKDGVALSATVNQGTKKLNIYICVFIYTNRLISRHTIAARKLRGRAA